MHVLVIPYNYPTYDYPANAIFIQEQVLALRRRLTKVGVLGVIPRTISMCLESRKFTFDNAIGEEFVVEAPAIRGVSVFNRWVANGICKRLFKKYLRTKGRPDVIHVHNVQAADIAIWIKINYNIPFVITEHSSRLWQLGKQDVHTVEKLKTLYEQSSLNIAVSKEFAHHLSTIFNLPFVYIPNVVDVEYFQLNTTRLSKVNVRLVSIGNLTKNKNHLTLVKAVHSLISEGRMLTLEIAGEGKEASVIAEYICNNRLQNHVQLLGVLSKNQVRDLLGQSDFFILPSHKETFGVVLIEAMASGLPVLAFKSGGPESIITSNAVGLLLKPESNLAEGLVKLMSIEYDSCKIREFAKENFSNEIVADKLLTQYSALGEQK